MNTLVTPGAIPALVAAQDDLDEGILAAGQLRQGKAPSMASMLIGTALIEVLRPRRSKALPRHFVLAVTATRVVAYKAWGGGEDDYTLHLRGGIAAEFPRGDVTLHGLDKGARSRGGTLRIRDEDVPVFRPN